MKKIPYKVNLFILLIWIPTVIAFFKMIENKKIASLCAGVGFVIIPILLIYFEIKKESVSKVYIAVLLGFLTLSSLPIFTMRVLYWDSNFADLSLLGIKMALFHSLANFNYLLLIATTVLCLKRSKTQKANS